MTLIAEFRLASPALPLSDALDAAPDVTLSVEQAVAANPEEPVLFVWATDGDLDAFESAARDDDTAADFRRLDSVDSRRLYRFQVAPSADVVMYPMDVEFGASRLAVTASHEGLDVRMRFPDRDAVAAYRDRCEAMDVAFSLHRLYDGTADQPGDDYCLTEKQRTALRRAVADGYFAVPRNADLGDVAADLGVSTQAASERVRRGVAQLVERTIGVPDA